jgi:hypothetical protein
VRPALLALTLALATIFIRYLMSLPTLRLTLDNRASEFLTTPLLADIRNEPLCHAAGI